MANGAVIWNWEKPINLVATLPATISWQPNTFSAATNGNFSCNIWLLRADNPTDVPVFSYSAVLLTKDQNVFNNSFQWTPAESDIDTNLPHAGSHQLGWEFAANNPGLLPQNASFQGFSIGFNIDSSTVLAPSSSHLPTVASTSALTSQTVAPVSSPTATSSAKSSSNIGLGAIIGLAVGLGILFLACAIGLAWFIRYRARTRAQLAEIPQPPIYKEGIDGRGANPRSDPVEIGDGSVKRNEIRTSRVK